MTSEGRLLVVVGAPHPVPAQVDRARWPVHVTIAPNFRVDRSAEGMIPALLESIAQGVTAFDVKLGPADHFGVVGDVLVLLAQHASFDQLHSGLATGLMRVPGFAPAELRHWRDGYRPHATLGPAVQVHAGETLPIRTLTLVSLRGDIGQRVSTIELPPDCGLR